MKIESGPARADRNWHLARMVVFFAFALWFVYDGAIRYPAKNRAEAEKFLQAPPIRGQVKFEDLADSPTRHDFEKLDMTRALTRETLYQALGEPKFRHKPSPGVEEEYILSRYGYTKVTFEGTRPATLTPWKVWDRTKDQIDQQFLWALVPVLPGLYFAWKLYKAVTLRVVVDDEGMTYGQQRIAFADMVSLRDYSPKGWIDLYYKPGGEERERKLRLDNEKVLRFDEIVAAICEKKGFRNEAVEYAAQKEREEAEAAEDQAAVAAAEEQAEQEEEDKT